MSSEDGSQPPARERWVTTPEGVRLCVAEFGSTAHPTIVFVHGYPDSKEVWSLVAERLADRFHVVLYDVRGHGRSSAPKPLHGGFTLEKLTDDFLAVADAVSPDRPVHLVGHDWGSVQGWEFATVRRTQGRIATFTSISGPLTDHFALWMRKRRARPTPRHTVQLARQRAKSWYIGALHVPGLPERVLKGPLGRRGPALLRRLEGLPDDGYPTPSFPDDALHGAWLYRDNIRPRMRRPRKDAYAHVPVQLVVPTRDSYLHPSLYDDLDLWVPQLTRRTIPAKHWVQRTRPDQIARWIASHVTAHDGAAAPRRMTAPGPYADRFGGQLVLVTGAASGIGRAVALSFAEAGARVVAVDRDGEGAARTAETARLVGAQDAWAEAVDVADEQAMEKLAARTAADHGVVDVLVNNAGVGLAGPLLDTTTEDWRRLLDVNLWGVIHGCRLFGRRMADRGQGGHIVTIASAAAFLPSTMLPAYSTSKAAVLMLTQSLRAELAGKGIGVTAVCPGIVNTDITRTSRFAGADESEEQRRRERAAVLYARRGYPPEKVADAVVKAVVHNRAVVPVTPEARVVHALSRLSPGLLRAATRLTPRL